MSDNKTLGIFIKRAGWFKKLLFKLHIIKPCVTYNIRYVTRWNPDTTIKIRKVDKEDSIG